MAVPHPYTQPAPLEARLVTKTSLSEPKKAISMLILFWLANDKSAEIEYGLDEGNSKDGGISDEASCSLVDEFAQLHNVDINRANVRSLIKNNPLFTAQMESLNAAFELVWHLASFTFAGGQNKDAERKGGVRYRKRIAYTYYMDLLDAIGSSNPDEFADVLFNWLSDGDIACDKNMENRLVKALAVFAETAYFKSSKGDKGIVYNTCGVYKSLIKNGEPVNLVDIGEEAQGPTRILKAAIKDSLNPMLQDDAGTAAIADGVTGEELEDYVKRTETALNLTNIILKKQESPVEAKRIDQSNPPESRNLIFFGAPGTGKSYQLNVLAEENGFDGDTMQRVTLYPDYTYSQFVGCFKPYSGEGVSGEQEIAYRYVPGPFLDIYMKARLHPQTPYLLVVEEINRSNPAAVFGDIFQLLDRDSDGFSVYETSVPMEMKSCLEYAWVDLDFEEKQSLTKGDKEAEDAFLNDYLKVLRLPNNLYIWSTMNSADQGVFPMDTAFKRRWDFQYMSIDAGEDQIRNVVVRIPHPDGSIQDASWNELRHGINDLLKEASVNEDKFLGPFFISPSAFDDPNSFIDTFENKVLLYLYEDAAKNKRSRVFSDEKATYSEVCKKFEDEGTNVFRNLNEEKVYIYKEADSTEE